MATANNLAHFGITGQKKGLRRFQSYQTAPTRSGMVGQEVGEAAEQAQRYGERDEKEAKRQANAEKRLAKRKKRWAKSYKRLERHADEFSNRELQYALDHLRIKNTIRQERLSALNNATFNGSKTLKNVADASKSVVGIYNVIAGGYNAYAKYKNTNKEIPFWMTGPKEKKKGGGGGGGNAEHSSMSAKEYIAHFGVTGQKKFDQSNMSADDYIAHFGVPGQQWFKRHFQSYKTAPTRSGKVGEEIGLAAKQAQRLGEDEKTDFMSDTTKKSDGSFECKLPKDSDMSFDSGGSERAKSFYDKYDDHRKKIIKSIADNYEKEYARDNLKSPLTQSQAFDNSIAMGLAWRKCKDSLEKSGMTVTVPSEKGWPLQITMDGGDIYGGHVLTFEYDDRKKKITKTGIAVEG